MSGLFEELRHRKVFRTAGIYLVGAWVAVEVSSTVFPLLGLSDWAPKLVLALAAAGFPVAIWWAWLFDLDATGVHESASGEAMKHARWGQASLLGVATIAGLTIPVFMFLNRNDDGDEFPAETASILTEAGDRDRTVAVLPFREANATESEAYFSEGITDEIVLTLARYEGLRVLSQAAGARLLAAGSAPDEIGRELGARFVLEGTIQRVGDRVRILPKLTDVGTYEVTWSADIDRDLTAEDLFEVQQQVAAAVAQNLGTELLDGDTSIPVGSPPTSDLVAYDEYLRGNRSLVRRTPASVARAITSYRRATVADSGFVSALAREAYASALFLDWEWTFPGASTAELETRAVNLAARALALDSTNADAWLARAYAGLMADRARPAASLPAFERALALSPGDPEAYHQYGQTLMMLGRYNEALAAYHAALALDPTRAMTLVPMSAISYRRGDHEAAARWVDSAVAVGSEVPYAWAIRANVRNGLGDHAGARDDAERALTIDPSYGIPARSGLAVALYGLGDRDNADAELERAFLHLADPASPGQTDALFIGGALVAFGRIDQALGFIERATPRSSWLWFYLQHPDFNSIREQPRFEAVVREADPNSDLPPRAPTGGR